MMNVENERHKMKVSSQRYNQLLRSERESKTNFLLGIAIGILLGFLFRSGYMFKYQYSAR